MIPIQDTIPSRSVPLITWLLIGLNTTFFALELGLSDAALQQVFYLFGVVPARYTDPSWASWVGLPHSYWPFVTSVFLHGGWLHIISNMWALLLFGDNVEERMGGTRYLIFYLLSGIASNVVHVLLNADSTVPAVGASGAIAGVMGAYLILFPRSRIIVLLPILFIPFFFEIPAIVYLAVWFYSQLFNGVLSLAAPDNVGGIAWWAHVGGFAVGLTLHRLFLLPRVQRPRSRQADEWFLEDVWASRKWR
ncbi:MAG: rhomboid family intramembrane serine protease [Phycisphaerales bacterium]|nr:rhomboid family intramembrane serine protease [Phycisphaerales bacterium]